MSKKVTIIDEDDTASKNTDSRADIGKVFSKITIIDDTANKNSNSQADIGNRHILRKITIIDNTERKNPT